jgi:type I restriction enzyme, S subunit
VTNNQFTTTPIGEIPVDWEIKSIDDICDILDSQRVPLNKEQRDSMAGDIPYYGANGVVDYINQYQFDEPLIIMAEDGGYFEEYVTRPIAYKIEGKSWINNHAHIIRPKVKDSFNWIFYNLVHKNVLQFISGGTRAKLNQGHLKNILIPMPPLQEQINISNVLKSVDCSINKAESVLSQTVKVKRGLIQQLFSQGIGHSKFKQTEIGEIPEEWQLKTMEEICSKIFVGIATSTTNSYTESGIPIIRNQNIHEDFLDTTDLLQITTEFSEKNGSKKLELGDVLTVRTGYPGISCVVPKKLEAAHTFTTLVSRPNQSIIHPYFLSRYINSDQGKKFVVGGKAGGAQQNLNVAILKKLPVPIPDLAEQERIVEILGSVDEKIENEKCRLNKLQILKRGLLQDLLSGKVRVKDNE